MADVTARGSTCRLSFASVGNMGGFHRRFCECVFLLIIPASQCHCQGLHFNIIVKNVCISRKQNVGMTSTPQFQYVLQDSSEESIIDGCEPDADRALSIAISEAAEHAAKQEEGRLREREIQRLAADKAEKRERIRKNVEAKQAKAALDKQRDLIDLESYFVDPEVVHAQRAESRAALRTAIQKDSADLAVLRRQQMQVSMNLQCDSSSFSSEAAQIEAKQRRQVVLEWLAEYRKDYALRKAAKAKE